MSQQLRVGIVGGGVVGQATARSYSEHCEVRIYDLHPSRSSHRLREVLECEVVFLCLPTPRKEGSEECDTSALDDFLSLRLGDADYEDCIRKRVTFVVKSTVPIGYTRQVAEEQRLSKIYHSPEFLTARCATLDANLPSRNIIGYPTDDPMDVPGELDEENALSCLYEKRFPHVPILYMRSDESEAVKLFQNSFFAVKVAYWNEVRSLADHLKLDWDTILTAILLDGRVDPAHTKVPGPDGRYGFGGACLPKDLTNLIHTIEENGLSATVTDAAAQRNEFDRKKEVET